MDAENFRNKFEGFVLAGGKSSRMGRDKAHLRLGGESFVERAAGVLSPVCEGRVKIVINRRQPAADFSPFECVRDEFEGRGAPGGIHAALFNSKSEWTFILACDLPLVGERTIAGLARIAAAPDNVAAAAVVPRQPDGRLQPLCAVYRTAACLPPLEKLLRGTDSFSVRDFLKLIPAAHPETEKTPSGEETTFLNVNTPEDYERLGEKNFIDSKTDSR